MAHQGRKRVVIENLRPEVNCGRYPVKRVIGEEVTVQADLFGDGHDEVTAVLLYKKAGKKNWHTAPMRHLVNDRWEAAFRVHETGFYVYTVKGWIDHFRTWQKDLRKKFDAGQDVKVDLLTMELP